MGKPHEQLEAWKFAMQRVKAVYQFASCAISFSVVVSAPILSGCAIGPLFGHETARTVGVSHAEATGGYGQAGHVVKVNVGLSENLDVGAQYERLSVGVRAKYAVINNREKGASLATALGVGLSYGGKHYYGDIIGSYLYGGWEPYGTLRFTHVYVDPQTYEIGSTKFEFDKYQYEYGQYILGTRYWFTPNTYISLEAFRFSFDTHAFVGVSLGRRN